MMWKEKILPSVVGALITAGIIAVVGIVIRIDPRDWLGIPEIQTGVVAITDSKEYQVKFDPPFSSPPVVTFGPVYSESASGEAFASMTSDPTREGFAVRLVRIGAGTSRPGDWGRGKVHWTAVGDY